MGLVDQVPFFRTANEVLLNAVLAKLQFEVFLLGDNIFEVSFTRSDLSFGADGNVEV